jgi:hypothetical protein
MNPFRFSLAKLFGGIVLVALGLAALVGATPFWANVAFTATLGVLLVAPGGVVYRVGARRAFWVGFLILGWSYLAFAFGPWLRPHVSNRLATTQALTYLHGKVARFEAEPRHIGSRILWFRSDGSVYLDGSRIGRTELEAELDLRTKVRDVVEVYSDPGYTVPRDSTRALEGIQTKKRVFFYPVQRATSVPAYDDFEQVGHSLFALLFTFLGGLVTCFFHATRERTS